MRRAAGDWEETVPALRAVSDALGSFTLEHTGRDEERLALRALVRGYLLPRVLDPDSGLVVAVVGLSGCGKSTLLNSLAGRRICATGPLRPTTTSPLVWSGEGLPPTLGGFPALVAGRSIASDPPPPDGLVLVDTPPPQVIGEDGRPVAAAVVEAADACLFVASGIRYADAAGWDLIEIAARRRLPSVFVLNRLGRGPEIQQLLADDFTRRLVARGVLSGRPGEGVIGVAEGPILPETGGLPPEWVMAVRKEMDALGDPLARRSALDEVLAASFARLDRGLAGLREGLVDEAVASLALRDAVQGPFAAAGAGLGADIAAGRLAAMVDGSPRGLAVVTARRCSLAARTAAAGWEALPAGRRLLAGRYDLWAHGESTVEEAISAIDGWSSGLARRAGAACGRTLLRRRRARRETEALRRAALEPAFRPDPRGIRRPQALAGAAVEARRELAESLQQVMQADAGRFLELVGRPPAGSLLARLRLEVPA